MNNFTPEEKGILHSYESDKQAAALEAYMENGDDESIEEKLETIKQGRKGRCP